MPTPETKTGCNLSHFLQLELESPQWLDVATHKNVAGGMQNYKCGMDSLSLFGYSN